MNTAKPADLKKIYNTHSEKIEEHILSKPEHWRQVLYEIRDFILHAHEQMEEFYKYKTPFFGIEKNICYMNFRADLSAIDIGFVQGRELEKTNPEIAQIVVGRELKSIRHIKIKLEDWPAKMEVLNQVLILAIEHRLSS